MIRIPLSLAVAIAGSAEAFSKAVADHAADLVVHMMGKPGVPAPVSHDLIRDLVRRVPDTGPVAERGPDKVALAPFEIFDDTPPPEPDPAIELALRTLRDTISG